MNRKEKEALVANLAEKMREASALLVVDYKGVDVGHMMALRRKLRELGSELKVAKARLIRLAARQTGELDEFADEVKGQVGIIFSGEDVGASAKAIKDASKDLEGALKFVAAYFDGKAFDAAGAAELASLPTREVLLTRLAFLLQSPISRLAQSLNGLPRKLAVALKAVAEKKG